MQSKKLKNESRQNFLQTKRLQHTDSSIVTKSRHENIDHVQIQLE